jgi:hypothetical protein
MQIVEKLDLLEFKEIPNLEELEAAGIENAKLEKKTWYPLPRSRFLEYLHSASASPLLHLRTSTHLLF